jgi:hypothetical protein
VSEQGVEPCPSKVEAIKNWTIPSNVKDLRSFMGIISYYRRFIKGFADIAKVLHKLTETSVQFRLTKECELAF